MFFIFFTLCCQETNKQTRALPRERNRETKLRVCAETWLKGRRKLKHVNSYFNSRSSENEVYLVVMEITELSSNHYLDLNTVLLYFCEGRDVFLAPLISQFCIIDYCLIFCLYFHVHQPYNYILPILELPAPLMNSGNFHKL